MAARSGRLLSRLVRWRGQAGGCTRCADTSDLRPRFGTGALLLRHASPCPDRAMRANPNRHMGLSLQFRTLSLMVTSSA